MRIAYARPGLVKIYDHTFHESPHVSKSDRLVTNSFSDEPSDIQNKPYAEYDEFWTAVCRDRGVEISNSDGSGIKWCNKTYFRGEV